MGWMIDGLVGTFSYPEINDIHRWYFGKSGSNSGICKLILAGFFCVWHPSAFLGKLATIESTCLQRSMIRRWFIFTTKVYVWLLSCTSAWVCSLNEVPISKKWICTHSVTSWLDNSGKVSDISIASKVEIFGHLEFIDHKCILNPTLVKWTLSHHSPHEYH